MPTLSGVKESGAHSFAGRRHENELKAVKHVIPRESRMMAGMRVGHRRRENNGCERDDFFGLRNGKNNCDLA